MEDVSFVCWHSPCNVKEKARAIHRRHIALASYFGLRTCSHQDAERIMDGNFKGQTLLRPSDLLCDSPPQRIKPCGLQRRDQGCTLGKLASDRLLRAFPLFIPRRLRRDICAQIVLECNVWRMLDWIRSSARVMPQMWNPGQERFPTRKITQSMIGQ